MRHTLAAIVAILVGCALFARGRSLPPSPFTVLAGLLWLACGVLALLGLTGSPF